MLHHGRRVVGFAAILAALVFAGPALAASPSQARGGAKAKERAYGKHCGRKSADAGKARSRVKCIEAMAKLASGAATSPRQACRKLSRKRTKGTRKSAFARCVSEGAKLLKATHRADDGSRSGATDDDGDDSSDEGYADDPSGHSSSTEDMPDDTGGEDPDMPDDSGGDA
jgi:hypothetical protein